MQTFLPYADYKASAMALDRQRLGKQRVEGLQLVQAQLGKRVICDEKLGPRIELFDSTQSRHPACKMWDGFVPALAEYTYVICEEWVARGYDDILVRRKLELLLPGIKKARGFPRPAWFGVERFHQAHRSNLLRKDLQFYRGLGWTDPDNLPYWWP